MNDFSKDLASLTTIPRELIDKLIAIAEFNICHGVFEGITEKKNPVELDIGIGILYIKYEGNDVKYKFIPSQRLEEEVNEVLISRRSPIMSKSTKQLSSRIQAAYKEFI